MTWLLKLYPPRWRRRYGQELKELVAAQPFSIAAVIDIIAGAIDAWIYPQLSTGHRATPDTKGEAAMVAKMMQLKCAGYGPKVNDCGCVEGRRCHSRRDRRDVVARQVGPPAVRC